MSSGLVCMGLPGSTKRTLPSVGGRKIHRIYVLSVARKLLQSGTIVALMCLADVSAEVRGITRLPSMG